MNSTICTVLLCVLQRKHSVLKDKKSSMDMCGLNVDAKQKQNLYKPKDALAYNCEPYIISKQFTNVWPQIHMLHTVLQNPTMSEFI